MTAGRHSGTKGEQGAVCSIREIARLNIETRRAGKKAQTLTSLQAPRFGTQVGQVHIGLAAIDDRVRVFASPISCCPICHGHLREYGGSGASVAG